MQNIIKKNTPKTNFLIFITALVFILFIGLVDALTGDLSFVLFYIIPIALVAWYSTIIYAGFISGISLIIWTMCNIIYYEPVLLNKNLLIAWSIFDKIFFFVLVIYSISKIKERFLNLEK